MTWLLERVDRTDWSIFIPALILSIWALATDGDQHIPALVAGVLMARSLRGR